jgi:hypothetical protein
VRSHTGSSPAASKVYIAPVPCHPFPHGTAAANRRLIQGIAVVNKSAGLAAGEVSHSDRLSFFSNKACELKVGSRSEILGRLLGSLLSGSGHPTTAPPRPGVVDLRARRRHVFLFRNIPYVIVKLCYNYSFSFTRRQTFLWQPHFIEDSKLETNQVALFCADGHKKVKSTDYRKANLRYFGGFLLPFLSPKRVKYHHKISAQNPISLCSKSLNLTDRVFFCWLIWRLRRRIIIYSREELKTVTLTCLPARDAIYDVRIGRP